MLLLSAALYKNLDPYKVLFSNKNFDFFFISLKTYVVGIH